MLKIYCSYYKGSDGDFNWLKVRYKFVNTVEECDIMLLTGGADIHPKFYGHKRNSRTFTTDQRDEIESRDLDKAIALKKFIIGICRGGQWLCVKAGGTMIQHIEHHAGNHLVRTFDGKVYTVNSIHHQLMNPYNLKPSAYQLIMYTDRLLLGKPYPTDFIEGFEATTIVDGDDIRYKYDFKEPEMVWFREIKGMAMQFHPEIMQHDKTKYQQTMTAINSIIQKRLITEFGDKVVDTTYVNKYEAYSDNELWMGYN
jgi:GMP synthase-like glutamine amidotransferase